MNRALPSLHEWSVENKRTVPLSILALAEKLGLKIVKENFLKEKILNEPKALSIFYLDYRYADLYFYQIKGKGQILIIK